MTPQPPTNDVLRLAFPRLVGSALGLGALALSACASGGSFDRTGRANDALHADLGVCETRDGDLCDASTPAACADASDFSVACECVADDTTGAARVRCAPPLPVPAILLCAADVTSGVACRIDTAEAGEACVLPEGVRCVCREVLDDPSVPAGVRYAWTCETPSPAPTPCSGAVTGGACREAGLSCENSDGTRCHCADSTTPEAGDAPSWICEGGPPPSSPYCRDVVRGYPDALECVVGAISSCLIEDGRTSCRCVPNDDGTRTSGRLECEGPPPPVRAWCPRELNPSSTTRIECNPIGDTCQLSSGPGQCYCVEDDLRDPARPVGYWSCDVAVIDPPSPGGRDDGAA